MSAESTPTPADDSTISAKDALTLLSVTKAVLTARAVVPMPDYAHLAEKVNRAASGRRR